LEREIPGAIRLDQYNNPLNIAAHFKSTAPELFEQMDGRVDVFVAGASTGGTISGVGRFLKKATEDHVRIVLADPLSSGIRNAIETGNWDGPEGQKATEIEGIGKNNHVECMDLKVVDQVIRVCDQDAFLTARRMAREAGLLCGLSSGANVWAALQVAEQVTEKTRIVTILPDGGVKYMSKLFDDEWLISKGVLTAEDLAGEISRKESGCTPVGYEHLLETATLEKLAFIESE